MEKGSRFSPKNAAYLGREHKASGFGFAAEGAPGPQRSALAFDERLQAPARF